MMSQTLEVPVATRRETRRFVIQARIQRSANVAAVQVHGMAVGLSESSADVVLDAELPAGEEVTVTFDNARLDVQLAAVGAVRRSRSTSSGKWAVTLDFEHPLSRAELDKLIPGNRIERRASTRQPIIGQAVVDWGNGGAPVPVQLKDISGGGFCMIAAEPAVINKRLHLVLETAAQTRFEIPARARWQVKSDQGYAIGCEFLYSQGYHLMHAIFAAPRKPSGWESFLSFHLMITLLGLACTGLCAYQLLAY